MKYDELAKRLRKLMPYKGEEKTRFEVPKVKGRMQGKKTIISNLKQIADFLDRDEKLLLSFLLKELATKGVIDGQYTIFNGNFSADKINEKVSKFVNEFVNCKECKKPDTKLTKTDRVMQITCMACGAKYPIRK
ncbi:MAG: translation initiation factor IF-2 subunit beta [Candidatus Nanoarchaeia archaeon]|nr:translation initiation factor IF-2 subunit beta [Candidatus Nanoarchaeia archaeon]MDD5054424.1 translation initiation factor IF-2 subunit beta [Candidatus Nanoarchaeia archaeon]MDD5499770.1 translation initiation factor IF-2 subunit beta [Candidatus Nanoarchaeia archaeon]